MKRILLLDMPGSPLSRLARQLMAQGISVDRRLKEVELSDITCSREGDLVGMIIHHERTRELSLLQKQEEFSCVPLLVWYPAKTSVTVFKRQRWKGPRNFLFGAPAAEEILARFHKLSQADDGEMQWLKEAMGSLRKIGQAASSGEDDFAILATTAQELERLFPEVHCAIMMIASGGEAGLVITQGDRAEPLDIPLSFSRYPEIQKMLSTRRSVAIGDVRRHPLMKEVRKLLLTKDLISILAVPIFYQEEVVGLIMLRSSGRARSFSRTEVSFCEMVAHHIGAALRSIRLSREMAEEMRKSREARRLAKKKSDDLARIEAMMERASDGIVVVDKEGRIQGVNINFTRLSGYQREDVAGKELKEVFTPVHKDAPSLQEALKEKKFLSRLDCLLVTKDGSKRRVSVRLERMPKRREWLLSLQDVTEERELEEALRHTKEFLENVIQSSMDAIIAADRKGTIILFNAAAEAISGYRAEEVIGKMNIVEFYAPGVARDIMRKLRSDDYGGRGRLESCYNTIISKNGKEIPINMSAAIIYEDGREVASVGIFQDLRERIRIEKELRQTQEQLMASRQKEAIMALAGAASHELNQPLTSILGYAEVLKRLERNLAAELPAHPGVAVLRNAAEIIGQEAERMAEVVRKLRETSEYQTTEYVGGTKILDLEKARTAATARDQAVWEAMFQNAREAIIVFGDDTIIRLANPASVSLTGENPIGKSFTRYLKGIHYRRAMEAFERIRRGETVEMDLEMVDAIGRPVLVHLRGTSLPEQQECLVLYSDVTAERRVEEELRELHAFYDRMLKNSSLAMVAVDVDGRITFWNRAAEKLLGYSAEEVKGKTPDHLIYRYTPEAFRDRVGRLRQEGELMEEMIVLTRSGQKVKVYHVASPMRDEEGHVLGFFSMLFDLSAQYRFEQELKDKTSQLALINQMVEAVRSRVGIEQSLGEILRQLAPSFSADAASILINDPLSHNLLLISYRPASNQIRKDILRLYEDADILRQKVFPTKPVLRNRLEELDGEILPGDIVRGIEAARKGGLQALLGFPLIFQGEVLGSLYFLSKTPGRYQESDVERLAQVSGPLIIALANARLFNQLEQQNLALARRNAWMEELIRATQRVRIEMPAEEIIAALVKPYVEAHPHQHLTVWLESPQEKTLIRVLSHNYDEKNLPRRLRLDPSLLLPLRDRGEAVEFSLSAPLASYQPLLPGTQTVLLVPLMALEQWLGIILLESHHAEAFNEDDKFEVQVLAAQIAGALRNYLFCFALDLSLRFRQALIDNANALILVLDREGKIELINRAFQELVEQPDIEFLGLHFRDFFRKHVQLYREDDSLEFMNRQEFRRLIARVEKGEKLVNVRAEIFSASGARHQVIFNTSSILDRNGEFQGFIAIGQNITRYQELQKHLLHAEKLATLGQMAAGIAHELNNPLSGIMAAADFLARILPAEDRAFPTVERLKEEARRIQTLVRNLMSYARPSQEEMAPLNLHQVVMESLSFSSYEFSRHHVEVETKIPADLPAVKGIKDQLQQVFINLLTNASHACADKGGGKITMEAQAVNKHTVEIRVKDNGVGISAENLPRLFDPFFTTKPEGKGTGLGLFIVKDIVSRHQGTIKVDSRPGEGSTFLLSLPVYTEEKEKKDSPSTD